MSSSVRRAALIVTALVLATAATGATIAAGTKAPITRRVTVGHAAGSVAQEADAYLAGLERQHRFSGTVLLAQNGHVIVRAAFGWANQHSRITNQPTTRFRIASLTKAFTSAAILRLADQCSLSVSDLVCRFIDRCPPAWSAVTLQELLTQSSGIPDYEAQHAYGAISRRHQTPAQLLGLVRALPLKFAPGTRWSYSNTGYLLLGMVIQRVCGESYAAFLKSQILTRLGLTATAYDTNHPPAATHALGYSAWTRPAPYIDMSTVFAAGALSSNVDDLYRWDEALVTGQPQLLSTTALQQMFHPWIAIDPALPKFGDYGYGWFIDPVHDEYDHDGLINGFVSFNAIFPGAHAVVIVLSNQQSTDVRTIADHIGALIGLHGF